MESGLADTLPFSSLAASVDLVLLARFFAIDLREREAAKKVNKSDVIQ